tara:strand:+ start:719 stop:1003 length:285 start_codon:yes stop_codon:yes gene_type:complete
MPIYEYKCEKCEHAFEEVLSISNRDKPTEEPCLKCGKKNIRRGISETTMGVDMKMGVPSWFGDKLQKMKEYTPKKYHDNLDKAGNRNGGKLGPQ